MGFVSALSNYFGNQAQADATENAANTSRDTAAMNAQLIRDMYNQGRNDLLPYMTAGVNALNQVTGGQTVQNQDYYQLKNGSYSLASKWDNIPADDIRRKNIVGTVQRPTIVNNAPFDATGGAEKYLNQLNQIQFPTNVDPTGGAQKYLNNLDNIQFPSGVDPTGGMQKYLDQLDELEFKLDTNDPIYQWRAAENERMVNQFMASRGQYDSRAAANMLLQSGMQLQSDETERQFNQRYLAKYQQLTDLAQASYQKGQAEYGAALDKYQGEVSKNLNAFNSALNLGVANYGAALDKYSADTSSAIQGFNASMALGGTKYNQLLDIMKMGTGAGQTAGAAGQNATNQLTNVYQNMSNDIQNALLQQGALANQNWQNVGNSANNSLAYYMMFSGG